MSLVMVPDCRATPAKKMGIPLPLHRLTFAVGRIRMRTLAMMALQTLQHGCMETEGNFLTPRDAVWT
jgi:hypothetical protein